MANVGAVPRGTASITGAADDFFLLHPFLLHAASRNRLLQPRATANICCRLAEPMNPAWAQ